MSKQITFNDNHEVSNSHNCQVFIALTGTREAIKESLIEIISQIERGETSTGKPLQGTQVKSDIVHEVITPIWNGKKYL